MNQNDLPILSFPTLIKGVNAFIIFVLSFIKIAQERITKPLRTLPLPEETALFGTGRGPVSGLVLHIQNMAARWATASARAHSEKSAMAFLKHDEPFHFLKNPRHDNFISNRHCEERKRRGNLPSGGSLDCRATLAMTTVR
jgi:hypothetical protein